MREAKDYYFFYSISDTSFWIVEKEYFHNNDGAVNDTSFDGALDDFLPDGFQEVGESCFHYIRDSWQVGREKLIEAGFTEIDDPEAR